MPNPEFQFRVRLERDNGEQLVLDCHPGNTALYLFGKVWKDADHFFHQSEPTEDREGRVVATGHFLWRAIMGEDFDEIANRVIESEAYAYHFRPQPDPNDMAMYLQYEASTIDQIPDDWA